MDEFDATCPRCRGRGVAGMVSGVTPPLSPPFVRATDFKQDIINGLTGFLLFLPPALLLALLLTGYIEDHHRHNSAWGYLPYLFVLGGVSGAWVSSGLPQLRWEFGAIIGGFAVVALALLSPALIGDSGAFQVVWIYFVLLLAVSCGGIGSVLRHLNLPERDDSLLIKQVGAGVLCFAAPLIGLFVSVSLAKNGSDYAAPALYGSIAGFLLIGLPLLLLVLGN